MTEIQQALNKALFAIAVDLQNEFKLAAPVDTGRLKSSIKVIPYERGLRFFAVDYAKFVEFGTYKQRANPFIRTTIHQKLGEIIGKRLKEVLQ